MIGAVDCENGVYVFLDVDGENVWNFTDALIDGLPRIAKGNTAFCVGHRDSVGGFCEQINYYINYTEFSFPQYSAYDLQESDFSKNNWEFYQNIAVADGALVSNSGETHAMAKYFGLNYDGEDAIRFQLKIASVTNQISFCLRADRDGGEMYWNAKMISVQINLTEYSIIFNHSGREADVRNPQNGSLVTPLQLNQTYLIEVGAIDTEDGVMVFLLIDEELQFVYTDTAEETVQVEKGSNDTFKIGSLDKSQFVVTAVGAEEKGKDAFRSDADLAAIPVRNENWANILNAYNPDLVKEGEDTLILQNKGGIAYADSLRVSQIDFDFQFRDTDATVMFMFNKSRRGTYFDSSLQQVEYQINMCYAVSLSANGSIYIQKASQSAYSNVDTLKAIWGTPFGNEKHHLTILFSVNENTNLATIEIYVDHALEGYRATDSACSESYRQGFIGIQKMSYGGTFTLSDLRYNGEVIDTTEGKNTDVKNVYLAQFYDGDKHDFEGYEGKNILRWSYTKDSDYVKSVAVKVDGVTIKEVVYPVNIVEIAEQYVGKEAQIVLATIDGTYSTLTVMLTDERDKYAVDSERYGDRIAIRENNVTGYAEFYYNDGTTPADQSRRYMPVGSNYLLLKDSWEPSTFDASPNVLLNNYDPLEVEAMLALLAKNNYNVLRVFLSGTTTDSIGGFGGVFTGELDDSQFYMVDGKQALYLPYMNNLTDFLTRCQKYGVYTLVVLGASLPMTEYFDEYRAGLISTNAYILDEQFIRGKEEYAKIFLTYIKEYDEANGTRLMNAIFAISNDNESAYSARTWPFNIDGEVTLANGKTYDMTNKEDRQRAADEGKLYFYERFVAAVKGVDAQLLTCEGMYTLLAVGNYSDSDPDANYGLTPISDLSDAFPTTLDVMMQTALDFLDVHIYHTTGKELVPVFGENMRSLKYNDAVKAAQAQKPIIMAEFGAFRSKAPTFEEAKEIIVEQRGRIPFPGLYHLAAQRIQTDGTVRNA